MKIPIGVSVKLKNNLKILRLRSHYSQEDIARKAYISREAYARIERNEVNPTLMVSFLISKGLGEDINRVFNVTEEKVY